MCQAKLAGLRAIDVDSQLRRIQHLMNMDVGGAWNSCDARLKLLGNLEVWSGIAACHLHVNRGRQAEVENLIGDICRFEEDHRIGEFFMQPLAEPIGVKRGGRVFGLERN